MIACMKKADPDRAARLREALRTNLRRRRGLEPGQADPPPGGKPPEPETPS
jgi:hypothetical protein